MRGCTYKRLHRVLVFRSEVDPKLIERIRSLLSPLGLRLEERGEFLFVVGESWDEVIHVAFCLSVALSLSLTAGGKEEGKIAHADLSEVEEVLAKIRRLREQKELWRRAGLPEPSEAGLRGWRALRQKGLFVGKEVLSDEELQRTLEDARILYARALAREIYST